MDYSQQVTDILCLWGENGESTRLINCLVEFLASDMRWLNENISEVDRETLAHMAKVVGCHNDVDSGYDDNWDK